jgi:hypothetical protein
VRHPHDRTGNNDATDDAATFLAVLVTVLLALLLALALLALALALLALALTLALLALALALALRLALALTLLVALLGDGAAKAADTGDADDYGNDVPQGPPAQAMHIAPFPRLAENTNLYGLSPPVKVTFYSLAHRHLAGCLPLFNHRLLV